MSDPTDASNSLQIISLQTQKINDTSQIQQEQKNESNQGNMFQPNPENVQLNKSLSFNESFQYSKSQSNNESFQSSKSYSNNENNQVYRSQTQNESVQRYKYSEYQGSVQKNRQWSNENPNAGFARRMNDNSQTNLNNRNYQYDSQQSKFQQDNQRRNIRNNKTNKFSDQNNQYNQAPYNYQSASNGKIVNINAPQNGTQFSYSTCPKFAQNNFIFQNQTNNLPPIPPLPPIPNHSINGLLLQLNQNKQIPNPPLNPQMYSIQQSSNNDESGHLNQIRNTNYKQQPQTSIENIDLIVENPLTFTEFYQEKLQKQLQESIEKIDDGDLKYFQIDISEQDNSSPFEYLKQFRIENSRPRSVTEDYIDLMANIDLYTEKLYYAIQDKAADHLKINNYNPQTLLQNNKQLNNYHPTNFQAIQQQQQQIQAQRENARSIIKGAVKSVLDYNENRTVIPRYARESDWLCQCGNLNFSYRDVCNKCLLIKPKYQYTKSTDLYVKLDEMEKQVLNIDSKVSQQPEEQIITQQRQIILSDFIWICKCCRSINYNKTSTCVSCNMYKMIDRNKLIEITKNSQRKLAKYAQKMKEKLEKNEQELVQATQEQKPKETEVQTLNNSQQEIQSQNSSQEAKEGNLSSMNQNNSSSSLLLDQDDLGNLSIEYNSLNNPMKHNIFTSPIEQNPINTSISYLNISQKNLNTSSDNLQISQENLNTSAENFNTSEELFNTSVEMPEEKLNTSEENINLSEELLFISQENQSQSYDKINSPQDQHQHNNRIYLNQNHIFNIKINQKQKESIFILDQHDQSCEADYSESESGDNNIYEELQKSSLKSKKSNKVSILKSSKSKSKILSSKKKDMSILDEIDENSFQNSENNLKMNEDDETITNSIHNETQEFGIHININSTDDSYDYFQYAQETSEQQQNDKNNNIMNINDIQNNQNYINQKTSIQYIPIFDIQSIDNDTDVNLLDESDYITNINSIQQQLLNTNKELSILTRQTNNNLDNIE